MLHPKTQMLQIVYIYMYIYILTVYRYILYCQGTKGSFTHHWGLCFGLQTTIFIFVKCFRCCWLKKKLRPEIEVGLLLQRLRPQVILIMILSDNSLIYIIFLWCAWTVPVIAVWVQGTRRLMDDLMEFTCENNSTFYMSAGKRWIRRSAGDCCVCSQSAIFPGFTAILLDRHMP